MHLNRLRYFLIYVGVILLVSLAVTNQRKSETMPRNRLSYFFVYVVVILLVSLLVFCLPKIVQADGQHFNQLAPCYSQSTAGQEMLMASMVVDPQPRATRTTDIIEINADNLVPEALQSKRPVFIYIYSKKSPVCRFQNPIIQAAANRYKDSIKFVRLDLDKFPELGEELGLTETPAHIFKLPGSTDVLVARGFLDQQALPKFIAAGLKK